MGKNKKTDKVIYEISLESVLANQNEKIKVLEEIYEKLLEETVKRRRLVDPKIRELIMRTSVRKQMLQVCGKDAFLLPDAEPRPKFPVMAPVVDEKGNVIKCEPHCGLVVAAYYRANEWKHKNPKYEKVAQKAEHLYKKWRCESKVPLHIQTEESIKIIDKDTGKVIYETNDLLSAARYIENIL